MGSTGLAGGLDSRPSPGIADCKDSRLVMSRSIKQPVQRVTPQTLQAFSILKVSENLGWFFPPQ